MSKVGQRLIASAREAREIVPDTIHMAAIPYLRLDDPTLNAVREALRDIADRHGPRSTDGIKARTALAMLEGK